MRKTTPSQPPPRSSTSAAHSGPERLDEILVTTKTRGWLALAVAVVAVVAVGIWSIVATLPQQIRVPAVISDAALRTVIVAPVSGEVTVMVSDGDEVVENQEIAAIEPFGGGAKVSVVSPSNGVLENVAVTTGQGVEPGVALGSVIRVPTAGSEVIVTTFLPSTEAILFNVGDVVDVIVTNIETSKRAALPARVTSIGISPASLDSMIVATGSPAFADDLSARGGGVVYAVRMAMTPGVQEASALGILPGEIVEVINTYDDPHPIELLFGGR